MFERRFLYSAAMWLQDEIDLTRLMKLASFGALVHGSTGHFFYNFLDSKIPGTAAITVAKKVFIDQVGIASSGVRNGVVSLSVVLPSYTRQYIYCSYDRLHLTDDVGFSRATERNKGGKNIEQLYLGGLVLNPICRLDTKFHSKYG